MGRRRGAKGLRLINIGLTKTVHEFVVGTNSCSVERLVRRPLPLLRVSGQQRTCRRASLDAFS